MTSTIAVISPHPDDAALSVGGVLASLRETEIVLITCFSESCAFEHSDAAPTTDLRSAEDDAYAGHIGARIVRLRLPDTNIRTNLGRKETRPEEEIQMRAELVRRLVPVLRESGTRIVFAPLAVGGHKDHLHCRKAVTVCDVAQHLTLIFYEDLPYAQFEGGPAPVRRNIRKQFPNLRARCLPFTEADMCAKLRGIDFYRSQIHPRWREDVERYALAVRPPGGAYGERVWLQYSRGSRLASSPSLDAAGDLGRYLSPS